MPKKPAAAVRSRRMVKLSRRALALDPVGGKVVRLRCNALMNNHAARVGQMTADEPVVEHQQHAQTAA
jgi:hypothetical protein